MIPSAVPSVVSTVRVMGTALDPSNTSTHTSTGEPSVMVYSDGWKPILRTENVKRKCNHYPTWGIPQLTVIVSNHDTGEGSRANDNVRIRALESQTVHLFSFKQTIISDCHTSTAASGQSTRGEDQLSTPFQTQIWRESIQYDKVMGHTCNFSYRECWVWLYWLWNLFVFLLCVGHIHWPYSPHFQCTLIPPNSLPLLNILCK